jgi:hypothetical protein
MKLEAVKCFWTIPPEDRKFIAKIFLGEFLKDKSIRNMFLNDMFDKKATSVIKNSRKHAIDEYAKAKKDKVVTKQDK